MTCPDCGTRPQRSGPFLICRNVECDRLIVHGQLVTTPWARDALGRELMDEITAAMPPGMAVSVGAHVGGEWTARVYRVADKRARAFRNVSETFGHRTAEAAVRAGLEAARTVVEEAP